MQGSNANRFLFGAALVWVACMLTGCGKSGNTDLKNAGMESTVAIPESEPPVLSKSLQDQLVDNLDQEAALALVQTAAKHAPGARSSIEAIVQQSKENKVRYDLTLKQGDKVLTLKFKDNKLVEKSSQKLE